MELIINSNPAFTKAQFEDAGIRFTANMNNNTRMCTVRSLVHRPDIDAKCWTDSDGPVEGLDTFKAAFEAQVGNVTFRS